MKTTYLDYLHAAWEAKKEEIMEPSHGHTADSLAKPTVMSFFPLILYNHILHLLIWAYPSILLHFHLVAWLTCGIVMIWWFHYIVVWIYCLMWYIGPPLYYTFLVLPGSMFLRIVGLFCLAIFMIAIFSVCGTLYDLNTLFTHNLMFLSSMHLSFVSKFNVGCFIMCLPILGPSFCVPSCLVPFSAQVTDMVCTSTHAASATACGTASMIFVCIVSIFCICICSEVIFYNSALLNILKACGSYSLWQPNPTPGLLMAELFWQTGEGAKGE